MSHRIRLNPCDYLFWGQHRMNAGRGEAGNIAYMLMDLEGHLEPGALRRALAQTFRDHPVLVGQFNSTLLLGRPQWKFPRDIDTTADVAAERACVHADAGPTDANLRAMDEQSTVGNVAGWNLRGDPLVRLELFDPSANASRLIIRWPHTLMDAEGAQWFLRELSRHLDGSLAGDSRGAPAQKAVEPPPAYLVPDDMTVDPLAPRGMRDRWRLFLRGSAYQRSHAKHRIRLMPAAARKGAIDHRVIHRNWTREQTRAVQAAAKRWTPPGAALYARNLAACVLRAIHRLYVANGTETEAYLLTLPMRVGASQPSDSLFEHRPMIGNYLVSPMLCIMRDRAENRLAAGEDILRQLHDYHARRGDLLQWAMMWAASLIHAWAYELIFRLPLGGGQFATGFSFYGEIDPPIRRLGPLRVLNLWGGGPNTNPPGLNPVFSRFEDRLNMTLTYTRPAISDELATEYVRLIEDEMFRDS